MDNEVKGTETSTESNVTVTTGTDKVATIGAGNVLENPDVYSRLGPIKYKLVRVEQNPNKLPTVLAKSGVALAEKGSRYYLPDYDAEKDGTIGNFVECTDDPAAPKVALNRLRKLVTGDIHGVQSLGELLSLVYSQYISSRNYFDAIDDAVNILSHYNPELVESLINKSDQHYMFDIRWLKEFGLAERVKDVHVRTYGNDSKVLKSTEDDDVVTWNAIHEVAVLTFVFIDGVHLSFVIYPAFEGLRTSIRLIRTNEDTPMSLYTDVYGNLHNIDFVRLVGDALRFPLDQYTAKYYGKYERAAFAPVGSGDVDEINNARFGKEFALSYINPHNITHVEDYLRDIKKIVTGTADEIEVEVIPSKQTS